VLCAESPGSTSIGSDESDNAVIGDPGMRSGERMTESSNERADVRSEMSPVMLKSFARPGRRMI